MTASGSSERETSGEGILMSSALDSSASFIVASRLRSSRSFRFLRASSVKDRQSSFFVALVSLAMICCRNEACCSSFQLSSSDILGRRWATGSFTMTAISGTRFSILGRHKQFDTIFHQQDNLFGEQNQGYPQKHILL